jgi:hypothetical protein
LFRGRWSGDLIHEGARRILDTDERRKKGFDLYEIDDAGNDTDLRTIEIEDRQKIFMV